MDAQQALALQQQAVERRARSAEALMTTAHQRAKEQRVEETRGPVRVVLSGIGDVLEIHAEGVSEETCDCIVAAIRAGLETAYRRYEAELRRLDGNGLVVPR